MTISRVLHSEPGPSSAWWFLGTLAELRNPAGAPRTPAVIELTIPAGGSPPLHVHQFVDDSFYVLEGELVVRCGEATFVAMAGDVCRSACGCAAHVPCDERRAGAAVGRARR